VDERYIPSEIALGVVLQHRLYGGGVGVVMQQDQFPCEILDSYGHD
jgi:hypothetical protein